ncbi:hypothetical protein FIU83_06445 [Halomonas sp. THAF5a]|uniref:DUF4124 domain-containing protein n=1 Tax=Halomonas sp. THAF5a TaxID=2587844 RepID=UPI0012A794FB|nr:DUF4124 domain-containing protein [Halomonas sp. THAF5a]QFU01275.1 hypothetical protein FIU83_06445 [Halomonas sp. THAF5a]
MMRWIGLALVAVVLPAQAQVYKCEVDGRTAFQDSPCDAGEQSTFTTKAMERRAKREAERERQREIARSWEPHPSAAEQTREAILADLEYRLYDPESLRLDEWVPPEKGIPGYRQYVRYRARALAGGMTISEAMYYFDENFEIEEIEDLDES